MTRNPLVPQCEYIYPHDPNEAQVCPNRAKFWVKRASQDIMVCGNHIRQTLTSFALPDFPATANNLITVSMLAHTTTTASPVKPYPVESKQLRALREQGLA